MTEQTRAGLPRTPRAGPHDQSGYYPGRDLGLPRMAAGAVASMARRVGALFIDWIVLLRVIVVAAIRPHQADVEYWTLLLFAAQDYLLTALTGFTIGKRLLRIRVVRLDGGTVGPLWGLVRTVMLADRRPAADVRPGPARPARPRREHRVVRLRAVLERCC